MNAETVENIQKTIGYEFKNKGLLEQAFTRKTYASKFAECTDNEVLEFLGDRILSFALVSMYAEEYGFLSAHGHFRYKRTLGKTNEMLFSAICNSHLEEQIKKLDLNKYMYVFNKNEREHGKSVADLFEAILGAVALDSGWNIKAMQNVTKHLLEVETEMPVSDDILTTEGNVKNLDKEDEQLNLPTEFVMKVEGLCKLAGERKPDYSVNEIYEGRYKITTNLLIDNTLKEFSEYGDDIKMTTELVAKKAFSWVYEKVCKKIVGYRIENPYEQLEELYRNRLVSKPLYSFSFPERINGKPRTGVKCELKFKGEQERYVSVHRNQALSKDNSAALVLQRIGFEFDESKYDRPDVVRGQGLLKLALTKYKRD